MKNYLKNEFNFTRTQMKVVLKKMPFKNLETLIKKFENYKEFLLIDNDFLKHVLLKYPKFLTYSSQGILKKLKGFEENLGFERDEFFSLLMRSPKLITLNVESITEKCEIIKQALNMDNSAMKSIIISHPAILTYNLENLKRTLSIFKNHGVKTELVLERPMILSIAPSSFTFRLAVSKYFNIPLDRFLKSKMFMENENTMFKQILFLKSENMISYSLATAENELNNKILKKY